jgi:hypothetical protein
LARVICPKCGWRQDGGEECRRCGIVFSRYGSSPETETRAGRVAASAAPRLFRRFYRVFRWVAVASSILALVLMLRNSPPPDVQIDPDAQKRAEAKVQLLHSASQQGRPYTLHLGEGELNSWLRSNLRLANKGDETETAPERGPDDIRPAAERVRSTVHDVKIQLLDDRVRGYVLFDFVVKDLSLVLEGRLVVQDRYLRLQPESGALGTLPLPLSILKGAAARLFDRPENRETFHVPPGIRDIRVEHSELIVVRR